VPSASEVTPVWHRSYLNLIQLLNLITVRLPLNNFSFFGSTLSVRNLGQLYRTRCCAGIVQILSSLESITLFVNIFINYSYPKLFTKTIQATCFTAASATYAAEGKQEWAGLESERSTWKAREALCSGSGVKAPASLRGGKIPWLGGLGATLRLQPFYPFLRLTRGQNFPFFSSLLYNIINTYTCIRGLFLSNLDYTVVR